MRKKIDDFIEDNESEEKEVSVEYKRKRHEAKIQEQEKKRKEENTIVSREIKTVISGSSNQKKKIEIIRMKDGKKYSRPVFEDKG